MPIVRDKPYDAQHRHKRTLADCIGRPDSGRGSGGSDPVIEISHKVYIDRDGNLVCQDKYN